MWVEFIRGLLVGALLLYGPGYLLLRGLRFSPILALCAAPIMGVCLYAGLPIAYYELGIPCSPLTVALPTLVVALVVYALSYALRRDKDKKDLTPRRMEPIRCFGRKVPFDVVVPLLFIATASLVCLFVFVLALPNTKAFVPRFDNQTHLNVARSFLDSQKWSSLHSTSFGASSSNQVPFITTGGFYPCAWTCMVVLVCTTAGIDLMVSVNVVVALAASVVFPLGMYAFFRTLFWQRPRAIILGAIATTGFATWPWLFVYSGPLFPNQLGASLQYGLLAIVVAFVMSNDKKEHVKSFATASIMSFVALTLTHPTTIFSCYVFLACFGAHIILRTLGGKRRLLVMAAYTVGIIAFWLLCFCIPALAPIIGYSELGQSDLAGTLLDLVQMSFFFTSPQLVFSLLSIVGIVCMMRARINRWLLLPACFFALGYVFACIDWWPGKHWIAAFWYSDWRRMAANLIFYLMPFVAIGLDTLLPQRRGEGQSESTTLPRLRLAIAAALVALVYVPRIPIPFANTTLEMPMGTAHSLLAERYREPIYSPEEAAFVDRAMQVIPKDALVINAPADGSLWSYGVNGINTYFRSIHTTGQPNETELLRTHLSDYATNTDVQDAVKKIDAQYVLLLDKDVTYDEGAWIWQFGEEQMPSWAGITSIDDQTPGFSVVLAEGNEMRLYKIER